MGLAMYHHHLVHKHFPAGIAESSGWLWSGKLLPFMEHQNAVATLDPQLDWRDPDNAAALQRVYPMFRCPSAAAPLRVDHGVPDRVPATYLGVGSGTMQTESGSPPTIYGQPQNGIFYLDSQVRIRDVTDGTSHTVAIGETLVDDVFAAPDVTGTPQLLDHWAVGTPTFAPNEISEAVGSTGVPIGLAISRDPDLYVDTKELSFSSRHPHGVQMGFVAGHVRFIQKSIDAMVWSAMGTKDGAEIVTD